MVDGRHSRRSNDYDIFTCGVANRDHYGDGQGLCCKDSSCYYQLNQMIGINAQNHRHATSGSRRPCRVLPCPPATINSIRRSVSTPTTIGTPLRVHDDPVGIALSDRKRSRIDGVDEARRPGIGGSDVADVVSLERISRGRYEPRCWTMKEHSKHNVPTDKDPPLQEGGLSYG